MEDGLNLEPAEAEALSAEATAFARALPEAAARDRYARLAEAAQAGAVPDDLVGSVETMLELLFDTGLVLNRAVLQSVYARTPRGADQARAARDVNRALEALRDQTIAEVRLSPGGPSRHTLVIETDRVRITLEIDRAGARLSSLEAG